jgi:predicted dehydrogenase
MTDNRLEESASTVAEGRRASVMVEEKRKFNVAIVGLSFGAEFIPIYQCHPNTNLVAICQRTRCKLDALGDAWGIEKRYTEYDELLRDPEIDIVHINTPPQLHGDMCVAGLEAEKHVACTIPMALSVLDCKRIVDAQRESGRQYMMMETTVYSREFLFVKELYDMGELGRLQFLRGSHQQDMSAWPEYWEGFPPMWNSTHAIAPTMALARSQAESVSCYGSGTVAARMHRRYNCPFAIETVHIKFRDSDLVAEITRSLFDTARQYRESFDVYGSRKSYEWSQIEGEDPILHTGEHPMRVKVPDYAHRLPKDIQQFTRAGVYNAKEKAHLSFTQGGGHGGSHPHLVHEFISALLQKRDPFPNARQAANITCSGILAHESAMKGGAALQLPEWTCV